MKKTQIGVIGCGRISGIYLKTLTHSFPQLVSVTACADAVSQSAEERAKEFGIPRVCTTEEILATPDIDIIANLTIPEAHYEINKAALLAGKHVYTEKPLALTMAEVTELTDLARSRGLMLSAAPDTILGGNLQTCRKLVDDGWIGRPFAANAVLTMGVKAGSYYRRGVGPSLDMGPYYIGAMVSLLGPVKRLSAASRRTWDPYVISNPSSKTFGESYKLVEPSVVAVTLEFASGCLATVLMAGDAPKYGATLEIYGTEGVLSAGDPNMFPAQIRIRDAWGNVNELPIPFPFCTENARGVGIADMAFALQTGRPHRLSSEFGGHCTEVLLGMLEAGASGQPLEMKTTCERPAPLLPRKIDNPFGELEPVPANP